MLMQILVGGVYGCSEHDAAGEAGGDVCVLLEVDAAKKVDGVGIWSYGVGCRGRSWRGLLVLDADEEAAGVVSALLELDAAEKNSGGLFIWYLVA